MMPFTSFTFSSTLIIACETVRNVHEDRNLIFGMYVYLIILIKAYTFKKFMVCFGYH